jgi:hypothetical protein
MKSAIPVGLVGVGVLLLVLSALWGVIFPASNSWTDEKSTQMAELTKEVHTLLFQSTAARERPNMMGGRNPAEIIEEYETKKAQLESLRAEFESQRDRPLTIANYLRWIGIAMVVIGGAAVMTQRG